MTKWESDKNFLVYFNKKKSWVEIHLWDVHPSTFYGWAKTRWGYFLEDDKASKEGRFGEIHFVSSRVLKSYRHELEHLRAAWWWNVVGETMTRKNEEKFIVFLDHLEYSFIRAYEAFLQRESK